MKSESNTSGEEKLSTGSLLTGTTRRNLSGRTKVAVVGLAVLTGLYHIITAGVGTPGAFVHRPIHLAAVLSLTLLYFQPTNGEPQEHVPWYDWLLVLVAIPSSLYVAYGIEYGELAARAGIPITRDIVLGVIIIALVLEIARRTTGIILPILASTFLLYAYIGPYLPGIFAHRGYSTERLVAHQYLTTEGVFGIPLGVSATFVILFIILGAFLEETGIGDWFIDVAYGLTGRMTGGPAKTSVIASGFMGSLSGSGVANTATTGAFTIPLMKRTGFKKHYAAAIESSASTGGQVMPPVMGAGAFIMAAWTGISYVTIIAAAVIPALLYFLCVGSAVHFRAKKEGIEGVSSEELPDTKRVFVSSIHYTIPLIVLVYLLVAGYSVMMAGFYAIILTVIVAIPLEKARSFVRAVVRADFATVKNHTTDAVHVMIAALERGVRMTLIVAAACALAGIVVGVITLTGLGLKFSTIISSLSGGVLLIALILTMISSIILGMGLPTTAAYIIVAALGAPALMEFGVDQLAAHMFVFYFAILSSITPPIMLAVFTGASIAESDPWKTGFTAVNLATVGFIVPYLFVYGPELLLIGSTPAIVLSTLTAIVGVVALAAATQGYLLAEMGLPVRAMLVVGAIALLAAGIWTDIAGLAILSFITAGQYASTEHRIPFYEYLDR